MLQVPFGLQKPGHSLFCGTARARAVASHPLRAERYERISAFGVRRGEFSVARTAVVVPEAAVRACCEGEHQNITPEQSSINFRWEIL